MDEKEIEKLIASRRRRLERAITPQGNSGYRAPREPQYKPATVPEWVYWPAEGEVKDWQAVSLSLNIDPDSLEVRTDTVMPSDFWSISPESFPDADIQTKFNKRIALIGKLTLKVRAPLSYFVSLFGTLDMPPEMRALIASPQTSLHRQREELEKPAESASQHAAANSQKVGAGETASDASPLLKIATTAKPATQEEIIKAFPIKRGWGDKLKKAPSGAYQWLAGTWAHVGSQKPGDATTYYPVKVAVAIAASIPQRMTLPTVPTTTYRRWELWWEISWE